MCGQTSRCGCSRSRNTRQVVNGSGSSCCSTTCGCGTENDAPTATISMADYQPFILVPTSVFDSGDVDCQCGTDW